MQFSSQFFHGFIAFRHVPIFTRNSERQRWERARETETHSQRECGKAQFWCTNPMCLVGVSHSRFAIEKRNWMCILTELLRWSLVREFSATILSWNPSWPIIDIQMRRGCLRQNEFIPQFIKNRWKANEAIKTKCKKSNNKSSKKV